MTIEKPEGLSTENLNKRFKQTRLVFWLLTIAGLFILSESIYTYMKTGEFSIAIMSPGLVCLLVGASQFKKSKKIQEELNQR